MSFIEYVKSVLSPFVAQIDIETEDQKHFDVYLVPADAKAAAQAVGSQGQTYKAVRQLLRAVAGNHGLTCHYYVDTEDLKDWRGNK